MPSAVITCPARTITELCGSARLPLEPFASEEEPENDEPEEDEEETKVALKMTYREVDGVAVVALDGRIVLCEESNALREKVKSLIAEGKKKIVLNMDNITFIDSAGLGEIVRTYTTVSRQGGSLKLVNLTKRITDLLSIMKMLTVFETFNSESEAVRSFSATQV